jgi:enoyl-CoA hydratase/carnithine racemase
MGAAAAPYTTLSLVVEEALGIATVTLNRPRASNALTQASFAELQHAFEALSTQPAVRAVVLTGAGANFCGGLDFSALQELLATAQAAGCGARQRVALHQRIRAMQHATSAPERFPFPVVCAIHGACVGGGVDLATAADVRYATRDARFTVKEADLAIVADLGTLQRLPPLVGEGRARELALTARVFSGSDAERYGLVSAVFEDAAATLAAARATAIALAAKSPLATSGVKAELNHARAVAVEAGLEHVAWRNASTLLSADIQECLIAATQRRPPVFARL